MADPIGAIAGVVGSIANVFSSGNQKKAAIAQADAQKYVAGQMTEQEYLRRVAAQETGLTGMASQIYGTKNQTNYLPMVAVAGLFVVVAVIIFKKS